MMHLHLAHPELLPLWLFLVLLLVVVPYVFGVLVPRLEARGRAELGSLRAADSLLYAQSKAWLATAGRCLPRDHRALLEMRQLVAQYEKAKGLSR